MKPETLKRWQRCVKRAVESLELQNWEITAAVRREEVVDGDPCLATATNEEIRRATLTWPETYKLPGRKRQRTEDRISMQDAAYHEAAHCKVKDLFTNVPTLVKEEEKFKDAEELLCDFITSLARRVDKKSK